MSQKPQPNHALYLESLRATTGQEKLKIALELADEEKRQTLAALRQENPEESDRDIIAIYFKRVQRNKPSRAVVGIINV